MPQYERHWSRWLQFIAIWKCNHPHETFGGYEKALMHYAHWRFHAPLNKKGKRILGRSISNEIASIISFLNNQGLSLERRTMGGLGRLLKGMDNVCLEEDGSRAIDKRIRPLTSHILTPMLYYLDSLGDKANEMAVLALGKACGLRPDNYLFTNNKRYIKLKDLFWKPNKHPVRLVVNLTIGKTNKTRRVIQYILDCTCPPVTTCTVHLVRRIVRNRLDQIDAPLFIKPNGKIFNSNAMSAVLRLLCNHFNLDNSYYPPYCLRIGAACEDYWECGDIYQVMKKYHWETASSCIRYLRESNVDLVNFIPPTIEVPSRPLPHVEYSAKIRRV